MIIRYSFEHPKHGEIEAELDCHVARAEHDVGIMNDYLDDWNVVSVPADCPLTKDEVAEILDTKEHLDAIEEQALQKASDEAYYYEDDL